MIETTTAPQFWIEWDMGDYGPFASHDEARDFQQAHRMTGSSIDRRV